MKDGKYSLEKGEPVYLGKTTPDCTLGWNTSLSWKGINFGMLFNSRFGGIVTSSTQAILDRFRSARNLQRPVTTEALCSRDRDSYLQKATTKWLAPVISTLPAITPTARQTSVFRK